MAIRIPPQGFRVRGDLPAGLSRQSQPAPRGSASRRQEFVFFRSPLPGGQGEAAGWGMATLAVLLSSSRDSDSEPTLVDALPRTSRSHT